MSTVRNRRIAVVVGAVAVVLLAVAAGYGIGRITADDGGGQVAEATSDPRPPETPAPTTTPDVPDLPAGTVRDGVRFQELTVQQGVLRREYLVLTPAEVDPDERLPVVTVLHGLTASRSVAAREGDWAAAVASDRFAAVFPQGVANSWNAGPCCPPATLLGIEDRRFIDLVTEQMVARPDVDEDRLFLTGFSNGAIMAYSMACARPATFAAVAPVAGTNVSGCAPSEPVSLLHLHGDPDFVVPYDGGVVPSQLLSSADFPPVPESVAAWARADGCDPDPVEVDDGPLTRTEWQECSDGTRVELVTYPGNRHVWPDGEPVDAVDEMLRFFGIR